MSIDSVGGTQGSAQFQKSPDSTYQYQDVDGNRHTVKIRSGNFTIGNARNMPEAEARKILAKQGYTPSEIKREGENWVGKLAPKLAKIAEVYVGSQTRPEAKEAAEKHSTMRIFERIAEKYGLGKGSQSVISKATQEALDNMKP